jgi:3D-(3,5/4)-trihydroxycyclohexane-1,2-dione acylhydrolase (decyclizing)
MAVLTDAAECGPVTLALPQDVQAEAYEYPETFFERRVRRLARAGADPFEIERAAQCVTNSERPVIVAGGGVHYAGAADALARFATRHDIPVAETQGGKGALPWDHECNAGAIGVTGSSAANQLVAEADLVIAVGTRLQDFTTGSGLLLGNDHCPLLSINVSRHDVSKRNAITVKGDALRTLEEIDKVTGKQSRREWRDRFRKLIDDWSKDVDAAVAPKRGVRPSDAQVLGVVNGEFSDNATVVCAAGGLPGELHKLWRASDSDSYHVEYGFSCMGYEIAGGIGVKMALPERDVVVMVGDGSYLMLNSEIATSIALKQKLIIVVLDNRGFGCINRLQTSLGGKGYNNLLDSSYRNNAVPQIDFVQHAASLGAIAEKVGNIDDLPCALQRARNSDRTSVVVIDTDPVASTSAGGTWWDVPVAEVSGNDAVRAAAKSYSEQQRKR